MEMVFIGAAAGLEVASGLGGMGLRSMVLSTEELVELLYQSYNIDSSFTLHQEDLKNIQVSG